MESLPEIFSETTVTVSSQIHGLLKEKWHSILEEADETLNLKVEFKKRQYIFRGSWNDVNQLWRLIHQQLELLGEDSVEKYMTEMSASQMSFDTMSTVSANSSASRCMPYPGRITMPTSNMQSHSNTPQSNYFTPLRSTAVPERSPSSRSFQNSPNQQLKQGSQTPSVSSQHSSPSANQQLKIVNRAGTKAEHQLQHTTNMNESMVSEKQLERIGRDNQSADEEVNEKALSIESDEFKSTVSSHNYSTSTKNEIILAPEPEYEEITRNVVDIGNNETNAFETKVQPLANGDAINFENALQEVDQNADYQLHFQNNLEIARKKDFDNSSNITSSKVGEKLDHMEGQSVPLSKHNDRLQAKEKEENHDSNSHSSMPSLESAMFEDNVGLHNTKSKQIKDDSVPTTENIDGDDDWEKWSYIHTDNTDGDKINSDEKSPVYDESSTSDNVSFIVLDKSSEQATCQNLNSHSGASNDNVFDLHKNKYLERMSDDIKNTDSLLTKSLSCETSESLEESDLKKLKATCINKALQERANRNILNENFPSENGGQFEEVNNSDEVESCISEERLKFLVDINAMDDNSQSEAESDELHLDSSTVRNKKSELQTKSYEYNQKTTLKTEKELAEKREDSNKKVEMLSFDLLSNKSFQKQENSNFQDDERNGTQAHNQLQSASKELKISGKNERTLASYSENNFDVYDATEKEKRDKNITDVDKLTIATQSDIPADTEKSRVITYLDKMHYEYFTFYYRHDIRVLQDRYNIKLQALPTEFDDNVYEIKIIPTSLTADMNTSCRLIEKRIAEMQDCAYSYLQLARNISDEVAHNGIEKVQKEYSAILLKFVPATKNFQRSVLFVGKDEELAEVEKVYKEVIGMIPKQGPSPDLKITKYQKNKRRTEKDLKHGVWRSMDDYLSTDKLWNPQNANHFQIKNSDSDSEEEVEIHKLDRSNEKLKQSLFETDDSESEKETEKLGKNQVSNTDIEILKTSVFETDERESEKDPEKLVRNQRLNRSKQNLIRSLYETVNSKSEEEPKQFYTKDINAVNNPGTTKMEDSNFCNESEQKEEEDVYTHEKNSLEKQSNKKSNSTDSSTKIDKKDQDFAKACFKNTQNNVTSIEVEEELKSESGEREVETGNNYILDDDEIKFTFDLQNSEENHFEAHSKENEYDSKDVNDPEYILKHISKSGDNCNDGDSNSKDVNLLNSQLDEGDNMYLPTSIEKSLNIPNGKTVEQSQNQDNLNSNKDISIESKESTIKIPTYNKQKPLHFENNFDYFEMKNKIELAKQQTPAIQVLYELLNDDYKANELEEKLIDQILTGNFHSVGIIPQDSFMAELTLEDSLVQNTSSKEKTAGTLKNDEESDDDLFARCKSNKCVVIESEDKELKDKNHEKMSHIERIQNQNVNDEELKHKTEEQFEEISNIEKNEELKSCEAGKDLEVENLNDHFKDLEKSNEDQDFGEKNDNKFKDIHVTSESESCVIQSHLEQANSASVRNKQYLANEADLHKQTTAVETANQISLNESNNEGREEPFQAKFQRRIDVKPEERIQPANNDGSLLQTSLDSEAEAIEHAKILSLQGFKTEKDSHSTAKTNAFPVQGTQDSSTLDSEAEAIEYAKTLSLQGFKTEKDSHSTAKTNSFPLQGTQDSSTLDSEAEAIEYAKMLSLQGFKTEKDSHSTAKTNAFLVQRTPASSTSNNASTKLNGIDDVALETAKLWSEYTAKQSDEADDDGRSPSPTDNVVKKVMRLSLKEHKKLDKEEDEGIKSRETHSTTQSVDDTNNITNYIVHGNRPQNLQTGETSEGFQLKSLSSKQHLPMNGAQQLSNRMSASFQGEVMTKSYEEGVISQTNPSRPDEVTAIPLEIKPQQYQPGNGTMQLMIDKKYHLPGYEKDGTQLITFKFEPGTTTPQRSPYNGAQLKLIIPYNTEGKIIYKNLKKAFDKKILFSVTMERSEGKGYITPRILFKTNKHEYPDSKYLQQLHDALQKMLEN